MAQVEESIEVNVPVSVCYNQWTQFEEFPTFMEGVERVRQVDEKTLHWKADMYGHHKQWQAEITLQEPDRAIGWRSLAGTENAGRVNFEPVGPSCTKVTLRLVYQPEGALESIGDLVGMMHRRVRGDLLRFKEYIETRGCETGAWRGKIHGERVEQPGKPAGQQQAAAEPEFVSAEPAAPPPITGTTKDF